MKAIHCDGFSVEVIRSPRRKTMALSIRHGKVCLRMPAWLALEHGENFVTAKQGWIKNKLQQQPARLPRRFQHGEQVLFQGQPVTLTLSSGKCGNAIRLCNEQLNVNTRQTAPTPEHLARLLTDWYKQQARNILPKRTLELAVQTGLQPRDISVKTYRARWGSCTRSGDIQLNWKLVMAPEPVIDYVIIHELCHLQQHNHSKAFWDLVERFAPDYREHRVWLKHNGHQLDL